MKKFLVAGCLIGLSLSNLTPQDSIAQTRHVKSTWVRDHLPLELRAKYDKNPAEALAEFCLGSAASVFNVSCAPRKKNDIVVGIVGAMTGINADYGISMQNGILLAMEKKGKVNGRPLKPA